MTMKMAEGAKLQMCFLLHHLSDVQLRHRVESIVAFSHDFVGDLQADQLRRYIEIKASDLPSAIAAKKTREFRCPPREQMNAILGFKGMDLEDVENCVMKILFVLTNYTIIKQVLITAVRHCFA